MARGPNELEAKAYELYKSGMKLVEIASQLNLPPGTIRRWKSTHKWDSERSEKESERSDKKKRTKGGQKSNKNAIGHGAPIENKNAEKFGFFSKYLPEETKEIFDAIAEADPLDLLWHQIQIAYAAIVRAQNIMYVTDKGEMIKELKKSKIKSSNRSTEKTSSESSEEEFEYEFQFAWDRQATFLNAQARAQGELRSLIKQYDELLHSNWEKASEEQKLRISKLRYEVSQITGSNNTNDSIKDFLSAVKPSKEDLDKLYSDEGSDDDGEEAQQE